MQRPWAGPSSADLAAKALRKLERDREILLSACRDRLLATIVVETALRLAAEPAGLDIFDEKRTGPVLGIGQPLMQHLHDREAGVEADEVGELQRPHRVVGAKPHRSVDRFHRADALVERVD